MRWLLVIFALIGLTSICVGAPTASPTEIKTLQSEPRSLDPAASSSLSSARKLPTNDVGLPSELAWQAWLIVAKKPDAETSFESSTVQRRISPKSVFVAPPKQACPDGYKVDAHQTCVKDVIQFNFKSHLDFLVQRLKANYPSTVQLDDSAAKGSDQKQSAASGPTQVNISLGIEDNWSVSRVPSPSEKIERDVEAEDTVQISVVHVPPVPDEEQGTKTEAVLTQYKVENGTKIGHENEGTFFRGNNSENFKDHSIRGVVVPVAEIIDDGNQTFTEVIDYEVPPSLGSISNNSQRETAKNGNETKNVEDLQPPTVVLLLSPTKITEAPPSTQHFKDADSHTDRILIRTGNVEVNSTWKNGALVNMSALNSPFEDTTIKEDEEVTLPDEEFEQSTTPEAPETIATTNYPEEETEYATDSNDEILDHGEAGMLVFASKFIPSIHPEDIKREGIRTVEETGGNISSESSISGDVILETTLLDLNTGTTPSQTKLHDLREISESERDSEMKPEVVFSPQDSHRLDRPRIRSTSTKRPETPNISSPTSLVELDEPLSSIDSSRQETMRYISSQSKKDNESDEGLNPSDRSHLQQRRRTTSNHDHVRFPEDPRRSSSSYVLFPSDHSNSINGNLDYKERSSSFADDGVRTQPVPKSIVPFHQKKTYWHLPPGWRIDDLQPPRERTAIPNGNQRQNPMLLRFWTRMPLVRDPSLTMNSQSSRTSQVVTQRNSVWRSIESPEALSQSVRGAG